MKGILVKSLVLVAILTGSLAAQGNTLDTTRFFDLTWTQVYSTSLRVDYPLNRDFSGGGARARGMGGAFIGVADGASAATWNPAGLYRQENQYTQPVISLSYQSLSNDASYSSQPYDSLAATNFGINDVATGVDFMSIVAPIRIKGHMFVGSIAYYRLDDEFSNAGMVFDTNYFFSDQDILDDITRSYSYRAETSYRSWANVLNIGFGTRLYDKWSIGLTVNALSGGSAQYMVETATWNDFLIRNLPGRQRGVRDIITNIYDTTSYSGVNFTLGLKYSSERFSGGLVIKTPYALTESIDILVDSVTYTNGAEGAARLSRHSDDIIIELDQPMILGVGAGYKLTEKLLLAMDVEYRPYDGGMVNRRDSLRLVAGGTNKEFFTEFNPYWNDAWAVRLGSEYVWETGGRIFPAIPLRIGFGYVQLPTPNVDGYVDENGNNILNLLEASGEVFPVTSKASVTRWSVGAGVKWAQIDLDVAYEKSSADRANNFLRQKSTTDDGSFSFMFTGYF